MLLGRKSERSAKEAKMRLLAAVHEDRVVVRHPDVHISEPDILLLEPSEETQEIEAFVGLFNPESEELSLK